MLITIQFNRWNVVLYIRAKDLILQKDFVYESVIVVICKVYFVLILSKIETHYIIIRDEH